MMKIWSVVGCLAGFLPTVAQAQVVQKYTTNAMNERAVPCPDDPLQLGYKHITDVNTDQETELKRIADGQAPRTPYIFPLCNNFKFLMSETVLKVLLKDVIFVCGYNGTNQELCVLEGHSQQVVVPEVSTNTNATFQGISFYEFTSISTKAYGAESSLITFNDCRWQGYTGNATAIHQFNPAGGKPMKVVINTGVFEDGFGRHLIDNNGGILEAKNISVLEGAHADSVIRTSQGGTSSLDLAYATLADLVVRSCKEFRIERSTGRWSVI